MTNFSENRVDIINFSQTLLQEILHTAGSCSVQLVQYVLILVYYNIKCML